MFINMEEVAEDAYKNTELLLSQYTKVMFRIEKNLVDIDYEMYAEEGKHLKEMLYDSGRFRCDCRETQNPGKTSE